ncbi:MAG: AhpC/TSA family protein [Bacteroidetes bacterium]|nr:MAG: AhpC/TSA family protein [Bacteroidota bacterium]
MQKPHLMMGMIHLVLSALILSCGGASEKPLASDEAPQNASGKFHVEMQIDGAPNDMAKLLGVFGNQNYLLDSAKADANGRFVFDADTTLPIGFYYVMLASDNSYFQLLLGQDQEFNLATSKGNFVDAMQVTGCLDNELLYQNLKFEAEFNNRLNPVNKQLELLTEGTPEFAKFKSEQERLVQERLNHVNSFQKNHPDAFFTKFKLSGQNPELTYPKLPNGQIDQVAQVYAYRMAFFNNVDFAADWTMRTPVFANKLRRYIRELTPQNADSLIKYSDMLITKTRGNKELFKFTVNWIALEYKTPKTMGTEALYVHLIDTYWKEDVAFWSNPEEIKGLRGEVSLMKPSLIGKIGQDIVATNERGEAVSVYGMKAPIKVIFMYSYDCEHCQKEAPEMVRVYNEWKNRGLDVFALCLDDDRTKWLNFIKQNGMVFNNAFDPERKSKYERKYHIDITPELYVLDKNNRIIASNLSPNQLPEFLQGEYAKNPW